MTRFIPTLIVACGFASHALLAQDSSPETPDSGAPVTVAEAPQADPLEEARKEIERLSTLKRLRELKLEESLAELQIATQRLKIEAEHSRTQLAAELAELRTAREKLEAETGLNRARATEDLAELEVENRRLSLELERLQKSSQVDVANLRVQQEKLAAEQGLREQQLKAELSEMQMQQARLNAEIDLAAVELRRRENELKRDQMELQAENMRLDLRRKQLMAQNDETNLELAELKRQIETRQQLEALRRTLSIPETYPADPFDGKTLTVSDRRIALNGPIINGTANYVTERIDFFNNQDREAPIFIVIDTNPGGSVMEGYRIVKAMQASRAPVHVVVKSFAASMAAVILTMADHSYAFPNAVILHHQPFTFNVGNLTQQSEQMEIFNEWARRLHQPVADKMGVTLDEFYKEMYRKNSNGDWQEFADRAIELKWVNHIVEELREEGILQQPASQAPRPFIIFAGTDEKAQIPMNGIPSAAVLPAPNPFDYYFLYNRSGFYRWPTN